MTIKMKKKLKKALGIYLPLIIIAFITAAPVIWSIITSFKMPEDVFKLPVRYIPAPATFSNYIISWTRNKFSMYFFNSLLQDHPAGGQLQLQLQCAGVRSAQEI